MSALKKYHEIVRKGKEIKKRLSRKYYIREKSLMEIWTKNPVLIKLRNRENIRGWCGQCSIHNLCGGCRARAYTYFGDLFGPDPNCFRRKTKGLARNSNAPDDFALPYKYGG